MKKGQLCLGDEYLDSKIEKKSKSGMEKCLEAYKNELKGLRSGRAHPALLDSIRVDYYGNSTALNQISSISFLIHVLWLSLLGKSLWFQQWRKLLWNLN